MKAASSIPLMPAIRLASSNLPLTGKLLWSLSLRKLMPFLLKNNLVKDDLYVSSACVDQGPTLKRFRAGSMGRARPIHKRTAHITIVVSDVKPKKK